MNSTQGTSASRHRPLRARRNELMDLSAFLMRKLISLEHTSSLHGRVVMQSNLHDGCFVTSAQAVYLAMALDEIVNLAFSHAPQDGLPVGVDIDCAQAPGGSIILTITDDGTGYEYGGEQLGDGDMRLKLLLGLARNAGAALFVQASPLGVSYRFVLPSVALV